jgi:hypothetical protein
MTDFTTRFFLNRNESIQLKLDTIYDMLQTDRMPKEVLDLVLKLQRRVDTEYDELAYHHDQLLDEEAEQERAAVDL